MNVLVVKMSSLGDIVHCLPALTDSASALPTVRFDWVVEEAFADLPELHPAVRRSIPIALRRWRRQPVRSLLGPEWRQLRQNLKADRYDAIIDAQGLLKSAWVASRCRGLRVGMDWRSARERMSSLAYQHRISLPGNVHAIDRLRRLFASALGYATPSSPADYGIGQSGWRVTGGADRRLWLIHSSSRRDKLWPEEHWIELARLATDAGFTVQLPWGCQRERARAERICSACGRSGGGQVEILPLMGLADLSAVLQGVFAAVAVDTGIGHLCAALGVPSVSLYGPTLPERIGTVGAHQAHLVVAKGETMRSIEAEKVWATLRSQMLRASPATVAIAG
ncbi:MAG: lipopolysaccharide heptosyltransferase I [Pseudomonadota bacterium]